MPELPDVEVYRRYLDATALHKPIRRVEVESLRMLEDIKPQSLGRRLKNESFESTHRHGKMLFAELSHNGWLGMHFGMTGELEYQSCGTKRLDLPEMSERESLVTNP